MNRIKKFFIFFFVLSSCWAAQEEKPKSRMAILEDPTLVSRFHIDAQRAANAFDKTLLTFTGKNTPAQAWRMLVNPEDTVGIHITAPGNPILATNRAILKAVIDGLKSAGVKPSNIIVWDKFADQMMASGYVPSESEKDWQLRSVLPGSGFDGKKFYFNEIVGKLIWGDFEFVGSKQLSLADMAKSAVEKSAKEKPEEIPDQISNRSFFAKIATQETQKIINLAIMSDHPTLGIYGACSGLAMACVDNNRRFMDDRVRGDPAVGEILSHDALKNKVVLHVVTGLIAQFAGGPDFYPHYTQSAGLIMMSRDPVALDTIALERMEEWRSEQTVPPIGNSARHLKSAAQLGVGTNNKENIMMIRYND
ncbi:MAG: DUF362 domain-containing protein [Verrucomicrobiota bacterium]